MTFRDPTPQHLEQLHPEMRDAAEALVNAAREVGVPLIIISSRRSVAEQRRLYETGRSPVLTSWHNDGRAIDVQVYGMKVADVPLWWWRSLAQYAAGLGLRWGGHFSTPDLNHFDLPVAML